MSKVEWTDELRAQVITKYKEAEPTPDTSVEIVKQIADDTGTTPNGVMAILHRDGCYVKKTPTKKAKSGDTAVRVNKAEAVKALTDIIEANALPLDADIISKLTGKAAVYITSLLENITNT